MMPNNLMDSANWKTLWVFSITLLVLTGYELAKQFVFGDKLSLWQSHAITIIFTAALSAVYFWAFFRSRELNLEHRKNVAVQKDQQEKELTLQKWANAFEFGAHGMVIADSITNRFIACNRAFARIAGRRTEEIVGLDVHEVFVPTERANIDQFVAQAESAGHVSYETWVLRAGEESVPVQVDTVAIRNSDGRLSYRIGTVRDITSSKQAENSLRESEARLRCLIEMSSDFYWESDSVHRLIVRTESKREVQESVFLTASSVGKRRWEIPYLSPDEAGWHKHRATLDAHLPFRNFEITRLRQNGAEHHISISGDPVFSAVGEFVGYRGVGADITERKQSEQRINELAFYDQLTGLPNRTLMLDRLKQALTASYRSGGHGALLMIDLDHFKTLNDTLGHDVGDSLLKEVAQRLSMCVREGDTVARLGGDEFVAVLTGLSGTKDEAATGVKSVAEKILGSFRQPYQLGDVAHHSTASIGVTLFNGDTVDIDTLMKQADLAMYKSKASGRNLVRFFDPTMEVALKEHAAMENDLRLALKRDQFVLHYQAQVASEQQLTGAEVLVRWQHPTRGVVSPADFIPLAEETGLILPLGRWVLDTVCTQLTVWASRPEMAHLTVAVNVSAHQFRQPDFVDQVLEVLKHTSANPQRLKLELTESLLVANVTEVIEKMHLLKAKGVGFSLDDFGTGYSSLTYLKRLPLDQLKIDQSFVRDVLTDPNDASIARTIIALAQNLGLGVIAEGVETDAQREFLAHSGCHAFQGYLFSRPIPLELDSAKFSLTFNRSFESTAGLTIPLPSQSSAPSGASCARSS